MDKLKIEYVPIGELKTYAMNAKIHTGEQIEQIKKSIQEFGFNDPIAVWKDNEIIEGHGRLIAAQELEIEKVPIIRLDDLTDEQRRAYAIVHNKITMDTGFDFDLLFEELNKIESINMEEYGFEVPDDAYDDIDNMFKDKAESTNQATDEERELSENVQSASAIKCPHCGLLTEVC